MTRTESVIGAPHRPRIAVGVFILASVAALILSVGVGSVTVSPDRIITVIADHLLPWTIPTSATDIETRIIWEFRLPRALLGFVVGAALAVAGAVLQAVVRNPLADPFVFGVSSGASVAAVATLTLATGALAVVSVPIAAFMRRTGDNVDRLPPRAAARASDAEPARARGRCDVLSAELDHQLPRAAGQLTRGRSDVRALLALR